MELIDLSKNCCECGNCIKVCQKKAITWKEGQLGVKQAVVDISKCINCGLCQKVCPLQSPQNIAYPITAYAVVSMNDGAKYSTSGGAFYEIAHNILQRKGVVFGALFDDNFHVCHRYIDSENDLIKLQGSKYVRSDLKNSVNLVIEFLKAGKWVLFSGTPCQVAAVNSFIPTNVNKEKLVLVDIICHGTPSQLLFTEYLKLLSKKNNNVTGFSFRNKKYGHKLIGSIQYNKKTKALYATESSYYKLFLDGVTYGDNCYECPFAKPERVSDITIGDYWGVRTENPDFFERFLLENNTPVSAMMINTSKGADLFNNIQNNLFFMEVDYANVVRHNPQLNKPVVRPNTREYIVKTFKEQGYKGIEEWFKDNTGFEQYYMRILNWIPNDIKSVIKNMIKK